LLAVLHKGRINAHQNVHAMSLSHLIGATCLAIKYKKTTKVQYIVVFKGGFYIGIQPALVCDRFVTKLFIFN